MPSRSWDVPDWFANIEKVQRAASVGHRRTVLRWIAGNGGVAQGHRRSRSLHTVFEEVRPGYEAQLSAIIACYKDGQAIPIMYERLKSVFTKLNIDYEIIFVNDCSPDDAKK